MIEARSLTKDYNHTAAVRGVSFSIQPGEILGYLGPDGAGRSTTLSKLLRVPLHHAPAGAALFTILLAAWLAVRSSRRQGWGEPRLKYDEAPEPAVQGLNLMA